MLTVTEANEAVKASVRDLGSESVALEEAVGRILAEEAVADAPSKAEAAEKDEKPARTERKDAIKAENDKRRDRPAPDRKRDRRRRDGDDGDAVVGFGDDVPAFMKIEAKV